MDRTGKKKIPAESVEYPVTAGKKEILCSCLERNRRKIWSVARLQYGKLGELF